MQGRPLPYNSQQRKVKLLVFYSMNKLTMEGDREIVLVEHHFILTFIYFY